MIPVCLPIDPTTACKEGTVKTDQEAPRRYVVMQRVLNDMPTVVARAIASLDEVGVALGRAFGVALGHLQDVGTATLQPFARYHALGTGVFDVEAGFIAPKHVAEASGAETSVLPGGPSVATWHFGHHDAIGAAYDALSAWMEVHGAEPAGDAWEIYHSEPLTLSSECPTEVVQPYRPAFSE